MKKLLLLSLFLIVGGQAMAQAPWSPVHRDKLYTYEKIANYNPNYIYFNTGFFPLTYNFDFQNIQIVSDSIDNGDTILILNQRAKVVGLKAMSPGSWPSSRYLWDFYHPSILNQEIRITPTGEYYFQGLDTFLLKPQAGLGNFWTYKDTIIATIIDLQADTLWNTPDSVKTILLSNNDTIKLSRSFGLLKFPDPDSTGLYCNLLGLQRDTTTWGQRTPDFWDSYNFNVGDVIMYTGYTSAYEGFTGFSYQKIEITGKNILPNGYSYSYTSIFASSCPSYYCYIGIHTPFNSSNNISFTTDSSHLKSCFHPNILSHSFGHGQFTFSPTQTDSLEEVCFIERNANGKLWKRVLVNDYIEKDSLLDFNFVHSYTFEEGLGFVHYNHAGFEYGGYTNLTGYVKNGDTTGTIYSDSFLIYLPTEKIESQNNAPNFATLAPNPSPAGHAQLLFDTALNTPIDLTIYNTMGQLVASRQTIGNETSLTLDYPELPKGLYLIRLKSDEKEQVLKWIIQ